MKFLLTLLISLSLAGCATTSSSVINKRAETDKPYSSILVLPYSGTEHLFTFDSVYYASEVYKNFTSIEDMKLRKHLEKTVHRNIVKNNFPRLVAASEIFADEEYYSYTEFLDKVHQIGVQAILLIRASDYWLTESLTTDSWGDPTVDRDGNVLIYTYLLDVASMDRPVWYAKIQVEGTYMSAYEVLHNHYARKLASRMRKSKLLY
jgi:hypothetical protein